MSFSDSLYDALRVEHYQRLVQAQYGHYHQQLLAELSKVPTSVFITIMLAICIPPLIALYIYEVDAAKTKAEEPKGCRKMGMKIESNLSNEFDKKFSEGRPPSTEETSAEWWRVKSMWIYPIKSCKGVELNRASIITTGMEYDRQFTFAQLKSPFPVSTDTPEKQKAAHKWEFITQRQFPLLATVRVEMWIPDYSSDTYAAHCDDVESGGVVILSFPHQEAGWRGKLAQWGAAVKGTVPEKHFRVPFNPTPAQVEKAGYKYENMTIWKDTVNALNMELEIPDELRYYLGISNKLGLFRVDNSDLREVHKCAPKADELGYQPVTGFQDSYPLHLINLASIRDVESQMPKVKGTPRLSAKRFRANIVSKYHLFTSLPNQRLTSLLVTGPEPYVEESWKKIKIGFYEYAVSCRTTRCKLPNTDQTTGEKHPSEPDRTLRSFRNVDAGAPNVGCLGMQMVPISRDSAMKVGDELTALEHGEHVYKKQ